MNVYSTREVSEVLGLPASTILAWTRAGLLHPRRGARGAYLYSFQDIALLRSARDLLDAEVPTRRVRRALEILQGQLPVGRPLSAVSLAASGDRIVVRDATQTWDAASSQILLDLDGSASGAGAGAREAPSDAGSHPGRPGAEPTTADGWFDVALALEIADPRGARDAYRRAVELDPGHGDALLNLGRLLHEDGDLGGAEVRYRAALEADPSSARAEYNLGVVLEDTHRPAQALRAYEAAVALDPDLAAAHFNLSRLHEEAGRHAEALGHLAAYKRILDRDRAEP